MHRLITSCLRAFVPLCLLLSPAFGQSNVILIMTDDQGYGDLGVMGHPLLETPHIDALAGESALIEQFYVSPVCTPTRAALMTGLSTQRTTAIDTYIGRAMMAPEEVTIAEMLADAGYATGIFGKWHLGDCYPMRPMDQGFDTSLVHRGGGIGQPSDPEGAERQYTDPILLRNGVLEQMTGYCTDIYFDEAAAWITRQVEAAPDEPFFAYIATNAPHGPFHDVPEGWLAHYQDQALEEIPGGDGFPVPPLKNADRLARIFAMISNIDENVGALLATLEALEVDDDTMVIYLHDNGPNTRRYTRGLRGMKGEVYEGGIRSPLIVRWPGRITPHVDSTSIAAHIDIAPTILEACGIESARLFDGRSLVGVLKQQERLDDRTLVIQSHRGNVPVRYHNMMVRQGKWKLVNASGFGKEITEVEPAFELYDLSLDPYEQHDLAAELPEAVEALTRVYDSWFERVGADDAANYEPPRIVIGTDEAPTVTLTRQDWRTSDGGWGNKGEWLVHVVDPGPYKVRVRMREEGPHELVMSCGDMAWPVSIPEGSREATVRVPLPEGAWSLMVASLETGAYQVQISRSDDEPAGSDRR